MATSQMFSEITNNHVIATLTVLFALGITTYVRNTSNIGEFLKDLFEFSKRTIALLVGLVVSVVTIVLLISLTPVEISLDAKNPKILFIIYYIIPILTLLILNIKILKNLCVRLIKYLSGVIWVLIPSVPSTDRELLDAYQEKELDEKRDDFIDICSFLIPPFVYFIIFTLGLTHAYVGLNYQRIGISFILLGVLSEGMSHITDKLTIVSTSNRRKQEVIDLIFGWTSVLLVFSGGILQFVSSINIQFYTLVGNVITVFLLVIVFWVPLSKI